METFGTGDKIEIVYNLEIFYASIERIQSTGKIVLDRPVMGRKTVRPIQEWTTKGFQKGLLGNKNTTEIAYRKSRSLD